MTIDWTLLLLVVIGSLAVIGLILALQTNAGRKRLGDAALSLAERLLAYAIGWLDQRSAGANVLMAAPDDQRLADARAALMILRGG